MAYSEKSGVPPPFAKKPAPDTYAPASFRSISIPDGISTYMEKVFVSLLLSQTSRPVADNVVENPVFAVPSGCVMLAVVDNSVIGLRNQTLE